MEAKDTLKTYGELKTYCHNKGLGDPDERQCLEAQAEISFKAGVREVGKWLEGRIVGDWDRLDEPATFSFTLLDLLKLRDGGKIPD